MCTGAGGPAGINFTLSLRIAPEKIFIVGTEANKHYLHLTHTDKQYSIQKAKETNRILLTRDLQLFQQAIARTAEAFLIENTNESENLASLAKRFKFKLEINLKTSRCPKCNTQIQSVHKDSVTDRIPETTSTYYNEFWECPNCKQIYWQGAHWKRIENTLRDARKASNA